MKLRIFSRCQVICLKWTGAENIAAKILLEAADHASARKQVGQIDFLSDLWTGKSSTRINVFFLMCLTLTTDKQYPQSVETVIVQLEVLFALGPTVDIVRWTTQVNDGQ